MLSYITYLPLASSVLTKSNAASDEQSRHEDRNEARSLPKIQDGVREDTEVILVSFAAWYNFVT